MFETDAFKGPGPDETFRENLAAGRFVIQRCLECETHLFYPRSLCINCGSHRLQTVEANGGAVVYATTVNRRRPEAGGLLNVSLVDLVEGPRLMTRVEGIAPEAVKIGMNVRVRIDGFPENPILVFRPDEAA